MGELINRKRVTKPLLVAGLGVAAYAGYRLTKGREAYVELKITPGEEAMLPGDFQKRLAITNEKVSDIFSRAAALEDKKVNTLHKSMVRPTAFVFSQTQGKFAELAQSGTGSRIMSRSATIFPCTEEDGVLKISRRAKTEEGRKGHQIFWGLTPEGIKTEAHTFGSDGLEPEQALDRIYKLVHAPDLEVMSLDETLSREDLHYRAEVDL